MATLTAPSRTATLASSSKHASSVEDGGGYDLEACLEILKKLAPKVTPDLPSLRSSSSSGSHTVPPPSAPAAAHHQGQQRDKRRSEEPEQRTVKRSRPAATAAARSSSSEGEKLKLGKSTKGGSSNSKASSSTSIKEGSHTAAPPPTTATSHKRAGSTSSVISLSELKARSDKAKLKGEDDGNVSSSTARKKKTPSSKSPHSSSTLTISTHPPSATIVHSISPTLPSPAPTISSHKDLKNTPQSIQNGFTLAPSPDTPALGSARGKVWTRDRFKKIAAICREKGRSLKHSGDKRMIEYSSSKPSPPSTSASSSSSTTFNRHLTPILALFEQIDAVILYAYAFWCEDQAAGQLRTRQASSSSLLSASTNSESSATLGASTSSSTSVNHLSNGLDQSGGGGTMAIEGPSSWKAGCITENWKSIFGLVAFVRGRAEKMITSPLNTSKVGSRVVEGLPRAMEIVVAWMNMLEALILQHITTNASRKLNAQAGRLLAASSPIAATPGSTNELSPPGGDNESTVSSSSTNNNNNNNTSSSLAETNNFLQSFLKLQSDLEKIHTLWPSSQNILLHPEISFLPSFSHSTATFESHSTERTDGRALDRTDKHEEDLLDLVLRKGRMAYDYEPTKLDDMVMPDLPREEVDEKGREGDAAAHDDDEDMDADGELDPATITTSTSITKTSSSIIPKSPEDLFKDEENYFRFSWPIVIHHSNSIAHTSSFGRALLFEMSHRLGIDYTSPSIV